MHDRILYIDRLKGFGIFLVVFGHVIQYNMTNFTENSVFEAIYSFHMPFFFFLSGYIADKTTIIDSIQDFFPFLKKKAISLLIPFFSWALVFKYFFTSDLDLTIQSFIGILSNQIVNPGLWFLLMLFEIMLVYSLFYVVSKKINKRKIFISDFLLLSSIIIFFLAINSLIPGLMLSFLLNFSFFFVGVFLSKFEFIRIFVQKKNVFLLSAISFMLLVGHYNYSESDLALMKGLKVIISLVAISLFYNLSKVLILSNGLNNFLINLGKSTLVIYVTQFSFLSILPRTNLIPSDASIVYLGIIAIPLSLILIYLCIGLGKIAETIPVLNLMLYGKQIKYFSNKSNE